MNKLNKEQLVMVEGGAFLSGSFLNALNDSVEIILNLGRVLGRSISRLWK